MYVLQFILPLSENNHKQNSTYKIIISIPKEGYADRNSGFTNNFSLLNKYVLNCEFTFMF